MGGKRVTNPAGSSNPLRGDVLRVLGVMKVATADQIQRATLPHLTYRHTTKSTEAKRKEARTASHRGALADLRKHGLTLDGGSTRTGERLRLLTPQGLEAASYELQRPMDEMGGTARGAGRTGATHAMTVNETILALLRPTPDLALLESEPVEAQAAAQAVVEAADGIGTIASYATEVPLPATGAWGSAGKGGAQADIVVCAPQAGVPLLFVEVDNCFEDAALIAAKFDKYMRFFSRKTKDTDGTERPMWRTRWPAPEARHGDTPHPPVLLVFHRLGPRNPSRTVARLKNLTWQHWQGEACQDFTTYDGKIPIVATGLNMLREQGPEGEVFHRFGRSGFQPLREAIGNPRRDAADARRRAEDERKEAEYKQQLLAEEKKREREAQRPICTRCGGRFSDERWSEVQWQGAHMNPQLCGVCKAEALREAAEAERQAEEEALAARQRTGLLARLLAGTEDR
ncbi:replication-relaxation family protein [Streptomyces sp. NPDC006540]|uniref:replication-relaxation family protein n=1 Tax=Streptomyces sp. NPDC006540 TaxID=3155353 RepID=UPI0033B671E1